jgi:hypothetical protein
MRRIKNSSKRAWEKVEELNVKREKRKEKERVTYKGEEISG